MNIKKPWTSKPANAWCKYIRPYLSNPGWIEDGKNISEDIELSKRELFALIILAHAFNSGTNQWRVGYDPNDGKQQNDGHVTNGSKKFIVEHKVVAQMQQEEVLEAILAVYKKSAQKGEQYGKDRILIIQPNKQSDHGGLIRISALKDLINNDSPFDRVLTLGATAQIQDGAAIAMHFIQHYPHDIKGNSGLSQIDLNLSKGDAVVSSSGIDWNL